LYKNSERNAPARKFKVTDSRKLIAAEWK